jgi:hypothetical protein
MPEVLDIVDQNGDPKEQMQSIRDNFQTLSRQGLKSGTYLLVDTVLATSQVISSTSYIAVSGLTGSFSSSGGVTLLQASIPAFPAAHTVNLTLFLDGNETAWGVCYDNGGQTGINVVVQKWLQLNAGNHKYEIKAKVDAGSVTIGAQSGAKVTLSIVEFLRG